MVYLMNLPGGWVADRILGQRRAVLYGGVIIALGHFSMSVGSVLKSLRKSTPQAMRRP